MGLFSQAPHLGGLPRASPDLLGAAISPRIASLRRYAPRAHRLPVQAMEFSTHGISALRGARRLRNQSRVKLVLLPLPPHTARHAGPALIGHQIVEMGQPREERLLASFGMMEPFHREQLPLDGVVGLIQRCWSPASGGLRAPHTSPLSSPGPNVGRARHWPPGRVGDVVRKVAEPLTQRKHREPFRCRPRYNRCGTASVRPSGRGRDRAEFLRELGEGVAQAVAKTCSRETASAYSWWCCRSHQSGSPDPIRRLLLGRRALKLPHRTGSRPQHWPPRYTQMPDHPATGQSWADTPCR